MPKFKCALVHVPRLIQRQEDYKLYSEINFCAMGVYSLAGELKKEGFDTEIIHLGVEKYLDKKFLLSEYTKQNGIKFAAFSLHWHPQSYDVIETVRVLKENNPDIFVMLGGFTSSYFAREILEKFPFVDAIIKGEGEIPIRKLARKVSENSTDFSGVPNLFWRKNQKIIENPEKFVATSHDLDTFEFFSVENMKNYESYTKIPFFMEYSKENQLNNPMTSQGVCLGRGCTGDCTWCGGGCEALKMVTGRDFISYRSADSVIKEIKMLKDNCGVEVFRFAFDPAPQERAHLLTLLDKVAIEFGGKLKTAFTLFGLPDKEILEAYSRAFDKDSIISVSPEFHNEALRKRHKAFFYSNKELEEMLDLMDKLEIKSELYFSIIPCVDESENVESENYGKYLQSKYKFVEKYYVIPIIYEPAALWTIYPEKFGLDITPKNFIDYYNDTKCVDKSFENAAVFCKAVSI